MQEKDSAAEYEVLELTSPGEGAEEGAEDFQKLLSKLCEGGEQEGAGGDAPGDGGTGAKIAEEAQNLPNIKDKRLIGWCQRSKLTSLSYDKCSVTGLFTSQEKWSL